MTVIRPNSISGINSITGNGGDINLFRADGSKADVPIVNNITAGVVTATKFVGPIEGNVTGNLSGGTINATSGTITGNLGVGGVLTYEDVTNIDSVGVITARAGINVSGGTITGDGSGLTGVGLGTDGSANTSGIITATAFVPTSQGALSHRNRIINGDMRISQRFQGTETTINNGAMHYILDRFAMYESTSGTATVTQVTSGYSASHTGSGKAMRIKVTGADTSLGGSAQLMFFQTIEGNNWEDLRFGTANAKSFTVSFSILASGASAGNVTGTYCVNATNAPNYNRTYVKEYTIDAVDTWKRVSLTFPGDTSGTWGTGNGAAIRIGWSFAGPNSQEGSADTWHSSYKGSTSNQKNGMANVNNFYFITDIQVEEGTVATPFERRSIGEELARCQRYCVQYNSNNANRDYILPAKVSDGDDAYTAWQPPVAPRTTVPTISVSNTSHLCLAYGDGHTNSPINFSTRDNTAANPYSPIVFLNFDLNSSVLTAGDMVFLAFSNNTSGGYIRFEWEL